MLHNFFLIKLFLVFFLNRIETKYYYSLSNRATAEPNERRYFLPAEAFLNARLYLKSEMFMPNQKYVMRGCVLKSCLG